MVFAKYWRANMVIEHILRKYGKEPVNFHYYVTHYPDVHAAGIRIFGKWKNLIDACGIDYSKVCKYKTWSREKILKEIKKLRAKGKPIYSNYIQRHDKPLYMAAVKRFNGWRDAVEQAGFDYATIRLRRCMTKEQIKAEMLELHAKGISLAYTNMRANYQYLMAAGAKKLGGGSWAAAREVCGITTNYRSLAEERKREKKMVGGSLQTESTEKADPESEAITSKSKKIKGATLKKNRVTRRVAERLKRVNRKRVV